MVAVRVPASSANLGPGFDALAVALTTYLEVRTDGGEAAEETHPAVRAFRVAGGAGQLSVRSQFPPGRGLGFSGAARVAGLLAAMAQQGRSTYSMRTEVLQAAAELEGHADNAAASLNGGIVAVGGSRCVNVPVAFDCSIVVWIPARETSTRSSRSQLRPTVGLDDAVFNIGRTALLVAAIASGDVEALRTATEDRLHQNARLSRVPESSRALRALLDAGAYCGWLSGSGPSIAGFVPLAQADAIAASLPDSGRALVLGIDEEGAHIS